MQLLVKLEKLKLQPRLHAEFTKRKSRPSFLFPHPMVQGPSPAMHRSACHSRQLQERSAVGLELHPRSPETRATPHWKPHPEQACPVGEVGSHPSSTRTVPERGEASAYARSCDRQCPQTRSGRTLFGLPPAAMSLEIASSAEESLRKQTRGSQAGCSTRPSRRPVSPRATLRRSTKSAHHVLPGFDGPFWTQRRPPQPRYSSEVSATCPPAR